jgi:hypothetical protein
MFDGEIGGGDDLGGMDERVEGEFRGALTHLRREMGDDAFGTLAMEFLLQNEEYLRINCPPEHLALRRLDEYHAERPRAHRGFE